LSGTQTAWWPPVDVAPTTKVALRWGDVASLRQIQGVSLKRQMNWHFGVSVAARSAPVLHVRIISRLLFTEDGRKPFDDPAKMHRLRRSFAKAVANYLASAPPIAPSNSAPALLPRAAATRTAA